jgi:hypothetical protein
MNFHKICLVFLLPWLVACSELQTLRDTVAPEDGTQLASQVPVISGNRGVHGWLADIHTLRTQPPEKLATLLETREQAFRKKPNIENRMRLVMLLLVDVEPVGDLKRARLLLNGVDPLPSSPDERAFISLLLKFLEGKREDEQKLSVLWKQATQQNQRIDELEQQLKALTSIEQNIQQREPPPVTEDVR